MSAGWVAGSTRARMLLTRRLGAEVIRSIARSESLAEATSRLSDTRFAPVATATDLQAAQRQVGACLLLELRLLAGWLPAGAGETIRSLAAWFEMVNVEDRLAFLSGSELSTPLPLGSLISAWPRAVRAQTPAELRAALRNSAWGDPGGESPEAIHLGMRLAWARRVTRSAPEARAWVAGALGLLVARERFLGENHPQELLGSRIPELGPNWAGAGTLEQLAAGLPSRAAWALAGVTEPDQLWRADAAWWSRVSADARALAGESREGRAVVVGVIALLAADAVSTSAALALASLRSPAAEEAFDALV